MAKHLIETVFNTNKTIINFDECYFKTTTSRAYSFSFKGSQISRTYKRAIASVSLFLCVISDGSVMFQLSTGNNNEITFSSWLFDLAKKLDNDRPGWRKSHIVLMDNAKSHKSETSKRVINHLRMPTVFTAPGSMTCLPVEKVFGIIKLKHINTENKTIKM